MTEAPPDDRLDLAQIRADLDADPDPTLNDHATLRNIAQLEIHLVGLKEDINATCETVKQSTFLLAEGIGAMRRAMRWQTAIIIVAMLIIVAMAHSGN